MSRVPGGAMAFCARCPTANNCCSRVAHGSQVENPFVFEREIGDLVEAAQQPAIEFLEERTTANGKPYFALQATESGCVFLSKGRCGVYQVRPIDCRLFPFDIKRNENDKLVWVVYTSLCPVTFDVEQNFLDTKELLRATSMSIDEIDAYADSDAPGMKVQNSTILEEVDLTQFEIRSE